MEIMIYLTVCLELAILRCSCSRHPSIIAIAKYLCHFIASNLELILASRICLEKPAFTEEHVVSTCDCALTSVTITRIFGLA